MLPHLKPDGAANLSTFLSDGAAPRIATLAKKLGELKTNLEPGGYKPAFDTVGPFPQDALSGINLAASLVKP